MNPEKPTFTNRLAQEKSPYLLQHQHNPVDWRPWGEEAFAEARRTGKPIFLSIGYSTCHWCHVMAHESFENPEIAKLMNEHFVNIKVDREERPDVDKVYMSYVQAVTGGGGWPMSVFLTPELKPFYGGTYFPPTDRYGRPGFPTLLQRLAEAWEHDHDKVNATATQAIDTLREYAVSEPSATGIGRSEIMACYSQLARSYDDELGGFGGAPKFPHPVALNLLFRVSATHSAESQSESGKARAMALFTLERMAAGGMHDHLGGGFHRYSVDRFWHIPHFEKMLYDQAQLACSYVDAFQLTHDPAWERIARDILDYVLRDMTHADGGFYSAEDADSLIAADKPEHAEGAFYVWTEEEIAAALGPEATPLFEKVYGVEKQGNAPAGSDPQGEFVGKNTLIQRMTTEEAAKQFNIDSAEAEKSLAASRKKLFDLRAHRPRPHLDDKIITAWNGLMISAFARAAQALGDSRYQQAAQRSAAFLRAQLWKDGALLRSFRKGPSQIPGFADDYASLVQGLPDLYETDFDTAHLQWALELQAKMDALFWDEKHGGYYSAGSDDHNILVRMKEDYDGAEPSPNSTAALNLLRLAEFTDSKEMREKAEKTIRAFSEQLGRAPSALPQMLCAVDASLATPRQIVIAGAADAPDTHALLHEVYARYLPNKIVLLADHGEGQAWLAKKLDFIEGMKPIGGRAAAYICENHACQLPVTEPAAVKEMLAK